MAAGDDFDALARELRAAGRGGLRASALLGLILALILAAVAWSATTEIDDVTRADGRVVPQGQTQVVQSAEGGVITAILVAEGDIVEAGAPLMEIDRSAASAEFDQETRRVEALRARLLRLEAEMAGIAPVFPAELAATVPGVIRGEQALLAARAEAQAAERAVLDGQARQSEEALTAARVERRTALAALGLIEEQIAVITPLVEARLEPRTALLSLRRDMAEAEGRVTAAAAAIARLEAARTEVTERLRALDARFRAETVAELSLATAELAALAPRLPALAERLAQRQLKAPVRGVVNRLLLTTRGGVAQPGQPLVEIVPLDEGLLVEAWIRPADIAFLHAGQQVRVKLTAYDSSRYGALEGEIERIGADAISRPDGEETAFAALVRTRGALTDREGAPLAITPGMMAEIDILNGRRTVMDYLVRPVVRVKERAFRD